MTVHVVQQSEHLSGIASKYGFGDYQTIWSHPANADLRNTRADPHVLLPGDQVVIPDKGQKTEQRDTGALHRFVTTRKPLKLRLILKDCNGKPIANTPCRLDVEDQSWQLTTDGDGLISQVIAKDARKGQLSWADTTVQLLIGHLDPVSEISGWRARLNNLGYNAGDAEDPTDLKLRSAIEQFQHEIGLDRDADCGPQTQAALLKAHGS